jgi:hypothetical protein
MTKLSESIWVDQYESNLTIGKASYFEYDKDTVISLSNAEMEKLFAFICANKSDWLAKHDAEVVEVYKREQNFLSAKVQNYLRIYEQAIKDDYTHDDAIRMAEGWIK